MARRHETINLYGIILDDSNSKICSGYGDASCGKRKHLTEFGYKNKKKSEERHPICYSCHSVYKKESSLKRQKEKSQNVPALVLCKECKTLFSKEMFSPGLGPYGLAYKCKPCTNIDTRKRKEKNKLNPKPQILDVEYTKQCIRCNIFNIAKSHFRLLYNMADGYSNICKVCEKKKEYDNYKNKRIEVSEKKCIRCLNVKTTDFFGKYNRSYDGSRGVCLDCRKIEALNSKNKKLVTVGVYLVYSPLNKLVKIGFSNDILRRIKLLGFLNAGKIIFLASKSGESSFEKYLHQKYSNVRKHGEWFSPIPDILKEFDLDLDKYKDILCLESNYISVPKNFKSSNLIKMSEAEGILGVYLIQDVVTQHLKIGSTTNIVRRFSHLTGANSGELKLIYLIKGYVDLEKALHKKFKHLRLHSEWFKFSQDIVDEFKRSDILFDDIGYHKFLNC